MRRWRALVENLDTSNDQLVSLDEALEIINQDAVLSRSTLKREDIAAIFGFFLEPGSEKLRYVPTL